MVLPVPGFSNLNETTSNVVHIWVGNTPNVNDNRFQNSELIYNPLNLFGCVKLITIGSIILELASSGEHYGASLNKSCKPRCTPTLCLNNGLCKEFWQGRFECECGLSRYAGKFCNESWYNVTYFINS